MRAVKPEVLSSDEYRELIDSIVAKAFIKMMEEPPEERLELIDYIDTVLSPMMEDDECMYIELYNTMRMNDEYAFRYSFRYGYVYFADEEFFNAYYEDCCPGETIDDIRREAYDEERFVSVGKEVSYFSPTLAFSDDLNDFIDIDDFAENILYKWKDAHEGEENV